MMRVMNEITELQDWHRLVSFLSDYCMRYNEYQGTRTDVTSLSRFSGTTSISFFITYSYAMH